MISLPPAARLLEELIALPSVNPRFLPEGDPRAGEARVAEHLASLAGRAGLDVEIQPIAPSRSNVIARLTPAGKIRQRVMLAPHMDTVGQPNIDALLKPKRVGGRIVGRGACDTKGCVTAMLLAACRVASGGRRPASTEILFTGLIDEECDQLGSRHYAAHGDKADLAIVGEPTKLEVITAHKGDIWIQLTTHGRAAHGSTPHLGINAAHEAAKVIEVLLGEYTESLRKRTHPLL